MRPFHCLTDMANAGAFARVPRSGSEQSLQEAARGTPNPLQRKGCEFNKLAPQVPERLDAPRVRVSRQQPSERAPPVLAGMARHG